MLIERIVELQLRVLGPLAEHVLLKLVIFMTKQKFLRKILEKDYYLLLKCCKRQCNLTYPYLDQITYNQIYSKMQDIKRVLNLNCK